MTSRAHVQADFHKMPFEDNSFDHCYSIEACCHSPDRRAPTWQTAAPGAPAFSPFDTSRQRQIELRAASSLGQPRPASASLSQPRPASVNRQMCSGWPGHTVPASFSPQARCLPGDHALPQAGGHLCLVRVVPGAQPTPARHTLRVRRHPHRGAALAAPRPPPRRASRRAAPSAAPRPPPRRARHRAAPAAAPRPLLPRPLLPRRAHSVLRAVAAQTDKHDPKCEAHLYSKKMIEEGDGLPDIIHTKV